MAASNIVGLTNYAGGQAPADLMYIGRSPFNPTDDRKTTLDDLFSTITRNITDKSLQWQDGNGTATVSAANSGKIKYSAASQQFQFSHNGGAYFGLSNIPFAVTITSNSATAFSVGPNGTTNPCFQVVANVASAATGISITGNAAGAGATITALSSGANETIIIVPKGTGNLRLNSGLFQFEGSTSAFPALKRNGSILQVRQAGDADYASIQAQNFTAITNLQLNNSTSQLVGGVAGSFDVGLLRAGAGYWRVTDASTGTGSFLIGSSSITLTGGPKLLIGSSAAAILEAGPNGETNPCFRVVGNVASAATGISITGRAAAAGVSLAVISSGANENLSIEPKGTGGAIVTSSGAQAFAVGPAGATNPCFQVVGNVASAATGISITGRAAAAGVSLAVISSGANEDLSIEPKGTGDIYIGNGITNASPASSSLNATGGSGTNIAGANLNFVPGKGTGTGIPGLVGVNYPLTTASGTTLQSLSANFFPMGSQMFLHNNGDITVTNTTETSIMGSADYGSKDLEAGLARAGRTFFIRLLGGLSVQVATTPTLQIQLKLGSTVIADTTAVTIVSGASTANGGFTIEAIVSLRSVGASAAVACHSLTVEYTTLNGTTLNRFSQANVATVDLTATQTWDVTATWVGASTHSLTIFSSEIYMDR